MRGTQIKQADEVRVFAHDAKPVVIGAVYLSDPGVSAGGFSIGDVLATTGGGTGTGCSIIVTAVNGSGEITGYEINTAGSGYSVSDTILFTGFEINVTSIDIPGTENRGVCLYAGATGNISVIMESGNQVLFKLVPEGTFLPILVTRVLVGTDVIALY